MIVDKSGEKCFMVTEDAETSAIKLNVGASFDDMSPSIIWTTDRHSNMRSEDPFAEEESLRFVATNLIELSV